MVLSILFSTALCCWFLNEINHPNLVLDVMGGQEWKVCMWFPAFELMGAVYNAAVQQLGSCCWPSLGSPCCPHAAQQRKKGPRVLPSTKTCTTSCWISNKTQCNDDFNFQRLAHHLKLQPHHDFDCVAHSIFSSIQCWLLLQFNVRFSLMHLCVFFFRT
jgi:hypothetical protein